MTVPLTKTKWLTAISSLAGILSSKSALDQTGLRDRLAESDALMRAAPINLRSDYGELREDELQEEAKRHAGEIEAKGIHWPRGTYVGARALFDLAVHIRALDELLRDYDPSSHARRRKPQHWLDTEGTAYVIPTRRPRKLDAAAGDGFREGYNKRGTLHHRIVPTEVEGLRVRVVASRSLAASTVRRPVTGGGAVFPGLKLEWVESKGRFLVTEVSCGDIVETIKGQISALAECHFIVWPELTIDDDALPQLALALKKRSLAEEKNPALVVAGSWHRKDKYGVMRNRAPLLDGGGRRFDWYDKFARFADKTVGYEDVTSGEELVVVMTEDCLASVCICKDFSDLQTNPWAQLPVDIVLVASMGEDVTMDGHLVRAAELRKGHGRCTFVVQQGLWNHDKNPTNYFLGGPKNVPREAKATYLEDSQAICKIEL